MLGLSGVVLGPNLPRLTSKTNPYRSSRPGRPVVTAGRRSSGGASAASSNAAAADGTSPAAASKAAAAPARSRSRAPTAGPAAAAGKGAPDPRAAPPAPPSAAGLPLSPIKREVEAWAAVVRAVKDSALNIDISVNASSPATHNSALAGLTSMTAPAIQAAAQAMVDVYGLATARKIVSHDPLALRESKATHEAMLALLQKALNLAAPDDTAELLTQSTLLQHDPAAIADNLQLLLMGAGEGEESEAMRKLLIKMPNILTKDCKAFAEGCRQSAKVLGVDYDRYAAVVANNYRITAYTAERLEKRVRGLMELFKCERGVVGTAVTGNPGIVLTETITIAAKTESLRQVLASSGNSYWRSMGSAPVRTGASLAALAMHGEAKIRRLRYLVETKVDVDYKSPAVLMKMSERNFKAKFPGFETWDKRA